MALATDSRAKAWISPVPIEPKIVGSCVGAGMCVSVGGVAVAVGELFVSVGNGSGGRDVATAGGKACAFPQLERRNPAINNTDWSFRMCAKVPSFMHVLKLLEMSCSSNSNFGLDRYAVACSNFNNSCSRSGFKPARHSYSAGRVLAHAIVSRTVFCNGRNFRPD